MKPNNQLQPGAYPLPPNCRAFVRDGKVIVSLKKKISEQCARCRSCKYFAHGFATGGGNYTAVCKARPKKVKYHAFNVPPGEVYYATLAINKACDKYEPKNPEQ